MYLLPHLNTDHPELVDRIGQDGSLISSADSTVSWPPMEVAVCEDAKQDLQTPQNRWVLDSTAQQYPQALVRGARVERCHDLALARIILQRTPLVSGTPVASQPADIWDTAGASPHWSHSDPETPLFLWDSETASPQISFPEIRAELHRQIHAVAHSRDPARLRHLIAAESCGALIAAEMRFAGLPWRSDLHDQILTNQLGPRPQPGRRPARLEKLVGQIQEALDAPHLNPDSVPSLLKALQYAGLPVKTTSRWALRKLDHPAIPPLMEYKKLARLMSAHGWAWMDTWVSDGRFRPDFALGTVVTGRWGSHGGGALQLPHVVRGAIVADPGWVFVVADAAQLEPRILAGLSGDQAMAMAGHHRDLYQGMVDAGVVDSREHAKVGMLGAMYGGTTGQSALVLPRLATAFPQAIQYVDHAARQGERGIPVSTLLGRGSPTPGHSWQDIQAQASAWHADATQEDRARAQSRAWGRFTRNFVVQGTAAEWALVWLAMMRRYLWELGKAPSICMAPAPFSDRPHLVFFLHDEVIVHTPEPWAEMVSRAVERAAMEAGQLLFGDFPVTFPVHVTASEIYPGDQ